MPYSGVEIFSTCPQSFDQENNKLEYIDNIKKVSRWSEDCGCKGILVYSDNRLVDPWLVSQVIIESTEKLSPLVAVQPAYMNPYTVATMITSFGFMYDRRVYLNMVAGGFKNDLKALNDQTPHDDRYVRLTEYTTIITELLKGEKPVSFRGEYYKTNELKLSPALENKLFPGIFVSGSSDAGLDAARQLGATAVQYPHPSDEYDKNLSEDPLTYGIRIGIISRNTENDAWETAYKRFPPSRDGQLMHKLAMKTSDSVWHKKLSALDDQDLNGSSGYWLHPFKNYKTMCPYLVGDYENVAAELSRYMEIGYRKFILDIPPNQEELIHINRVFELAKEQVVA